MGYDVNNPSYEMLTGTAELGIRLAVSWLPAIFMAISLFLTFRYKMKKRDHELIQQVIKQKHETGSCEISGSDKKRLEEIAGQRWEDMWIGQTGVDRKLEEVLDL